MGLLDGTTQAEYYAGSDYGNYQFTSLDDIINQFQIAYVGEDKIISKIKRADIAFHAQRAMQELSFDTFKSIKAKEVTVPTSLQIVLPQDYVNYTKISWVDSAGIKHLLYPTSKTSNPPNSFQDTATFEIKARGTITGTKTAMTLDDQYNNILVGMTVSGVGIVPGTLVEASQLSSGVTLLTIDTALDLTGTNAGMPAIAASNVTINDAEYTFASNDESVIITPDTQIFTEEAELSLNKAYIDFDDAHADISVGDLVSHEYFPVGTIVTAITAQTGKAIGTRIYVSNPATATTGSNQEITFASPNPLSDTWSRYKSSTPAENNNDDYEGDTYWPIAGERYGLDPQNAQTNGSFYIDQQSGKIHFSSNVSGKIVILDYISDGLGTDAEMQVHKFAEEAMYKSILCAIMSAKANVGGRQLAYYKKDKFATIRTAKLRLSNIKLEELTQILRGKSKHIKH